MKQDGRKRRWHEHKIARREELVDGTINAIRTRGHEIGMDEIAAEIGVSKTVLYRYFTDKSDLTTATMLRYVETVLAPRIYAAVAEDLDEYELTRAMDLLKTLTDSLGNMKSAYNGLYDKIRFNLLPNVMEQKDIESFTVSGIGRVSLTSDVRVSIPAAKKQDAYDWLDENGHGDLIQMTINAGTLNAFARRKLRDGEPLPEAFFKVVPFTRATITRKGVK